MDGECGPAIGIDLGTTYSCVGIWRNGSVEIIVNGQGNRTTPSYVAFTDKERLIGEGAKNQAAMNPLNTIFDAKRLIGRRFSEESVQSDMRLWPFKVIAGSQDNPMIVVRYKNEEKQFAPEEISSMILSQMRGIAEVYLGKMVKEAVITVPAYFNDMQRCATKDAGTIAGLNVMRIINEPTAAALAYGINMKANGITSKRNVLIFDLGGGTFDVSVLEIEDGVFEVKATNGDTHLGGEDFDNRMVEYLVEMFRRKHGKDVRTSPRALRRLRTACERAKRFLSFATEATVEVDSLFDGVDFHTSISRARFEDINMDLFVKCMGPVKQCLEDAKIDKCMIDDVVIVGGSTRIPRVQKLLREFFEGKSLSNSINADEAVAYGAAVQAAMLNADTSQTVQELVLLDVTPLSLGIETKGGIMSTVVPRNTHIPCKMEKIFWNRDHKIAVDILVYEGERSMVMDNNLLGRFKLLGVQKKPGSTVKIPVTFQIDSNGILSVSATSEGSSGKGSITITNNMRSLAKEEIERMIRDAKRYKYEDEQRKMIADAKNELETFVCSIKNIIRDVAVTRKLRYEEMDQIETAISEALNWLVLESSTAGLHQIQCRKTDMEELWNPIKARLQL